MMQMLDELQIYRKQQGKGDCMKRYYVRVTDEALKDLESPTFYGWVFGFSGDIKILEPKAAVEEMKKMSARIVKSKQQECGSTPR